MTKTPKNIKILLYSRLTFGISKESISINRLLLGSDSQDNHSFGHLGNDYCMTMHYTKHLGYIEVEYKILALT